MKDRNRERSAALRGGAVTAIAIASLWAGAARAQDALPAGGTPVDPASVRISTAADKVTVTQTSQRGVINWRSFDVGQNNSVVFVQPNADSATLNRVTGGTSSTIAGRIVATGSVYLVNPNGIAITATGQVQTGGGFVASTLGLSDADFLAGANRFTGSGASKGVTNAGRIAANGFAALLGGSVANAGTISVPAGRVALGSGEAITLDINGGNFLSVAVPTKAAFAGAFVRMGGTITGARVELSAASAADAVRNIINLSGTINADSATGDGGRIVLLGGDGGKVVVSGTLSARAAGATGNGGFVETSGATVDYTGIRVDTSAKAGRTGTWLIDPVDLIVDTSAAATIATNLATSNVTLQTTATTATGPGTQSNGNGDIFINSAIRWTSGNTLSLLAYRNIALNAAIDGRAGGLSLSAGNGTGAIAAIAAVDVGLFNLTNGNWIQSATTLPTFRATDFRFDPTRASFLRVAGGGGSVSAPYRIVDVYGLQGMASSSLLSGNFALVGAIDASGTANWNDGKGFVAIGTNGQGSILSSANGAGFTGTLAGGGNVVTGLTIRRDAALQGLFGYAGNASRITGLTLSGGSVQGADYTGSLIGYGFGTSVSDVKSSVDVTNTRDYAGGLIGAMVGTVSNASASGSVTGVNNVGGLIGFTTGTVSNASASGSVTGMDGVGGLVGQNDGSVTASSATGAVTGRSHTGGLIGLNTSFVSTSFATGAVTGGNSVGGLIGFQDGSGGIDRTFASGTVRSTGGNRSYAGGLIGAFYANGSTVSRSYATGAVSGAETNGGLIGVSNATITQSYATGAVSGGARRGGVVGQFDSGSIASSVYWDSYSTGQATAIGNASPVTVSAVAVTSDPARATAANYAYKTSTYAGLTAGDWAFLDGQTRPFGMWEVPANGAAIINSHQLQLIGYNTVTRAGSYTLGRDIDLGETGAVVAGTPGSYAGIWAATGFMAIGTSGPASGSATGFSGGFDGRGFTVSNLTINRTTGFQGLFGYANGSGDIGNLSLVGGSVRGLSYVGSLIGYAIGTSVSNASASVSVVGRGDYIGGLIGSSDGTVINVSASGSVTGRTIVGGLVGWARSATIANASASGNVTASSDFVGGLIGNGVTIQLRNSRASGTVRGGDRVGGLIGNGSGTISSSSASGDVFGRAAVGGLIGYASTGSIDTSSATGSATGTGYAVGGLIGYNWASVSTSFATGAVIGNDDVGGLIGLHYTAMTIDRTYATGAVRSTAAARPTGTAQAVAGGLVGKVSTTGSISNSYATGSVTGAGINGGLVGELRGSVTQSYATGSVGGAYLNGGLVGALYGGSLASSVYWDRYSTTRSNPVGLIGGGSTWAATSVTSDPSQASAPDYAYKTAAYASLTAADWIFFDGRTRPFGAWEVPTSGGTITNSHQLQLIGANAATLAGRYGLGGNIDLAETGRAQGTTPGSYSGMWATTGFVPIGVDNAGNVWDGAAYRAIGSITSGLYGFTGELNGNGFAVNGLFVNRPNSKYVGLFGVASGTIANLSVAGRVTGGNATGGVVGLLLKDRGTGMIDRVTSDVVVQGQQQTGGIVGNAGSGTVLTTVRARGDVTGTNNVGGIVGYANRATIRDAAARGRVTGDAYVGGAVGYQFNSLSDGVFASGQVGGRLAVGALIGVVDGGRVTGNSQSTLVPYGTAPTVDVPTFGRIINGAVVPDKVEPIE